MISVGRGFEIIKLCESESFSKTTPKSSVSLLDIDFNNFILDSFKTARPSIVAIHTLAESSITIELTVSFGKPEFDSL